jgi:hypothetical protein
MSYQGYLTDNGGTPLTGSYTLAFKLYADSLITTPLWTESYAGVPVSGGVFHVALGSVSPLDASILSGAKLYLVTSVNGVDVLPRRPIVTVAYAFRAGVADSAVHAATGTGDIIGQVQASCAAGSGGILVYIAGRSFVAYTASNGTFDLGSLPPGSYKVHIEGVGVGSTDIGPISVTAGGTNNVGIVALGANLATDPSNCGACGNVCGSANGSASCVSGNCQLACNAGYSNCDNVTANGCEINTQTNPANCGACGNVCPNAPNSSPICSGGVCGISACNAGYSNCDNLAANGCEVNTTADPNNCGACGNVCPLAAHVVSTACFSGTCVMGSCAAGYSNCNGNPSDGCEINVVTDTNNCGSCGHVCASGHACSGGVCQ